MDKVKCSKELYCQFLLTAQKEFSATILADLKDSISHDKVTRWLVATKLTPKVLWEQVEQLIDKTDGFLVLDDSVLKKPYSREIELTKWQYSGNIHIKAVGFVKVFKIVHSQTGDIEYLATNDLDMNLVDIRKVAAHRWKIEGYHRGLKQTVGIEYCQARNQRSQRTHIFCSLLAFVTLEVKRLNSGVTWYQSKRDVIQSAMRYYLEKPSISFNFS